MNIVRLKQSVDNFNERKAREERGSARAARAAKASLASAGVAAPVNESDINERQQERKLLIKKICTKYKAA